LDPIFDANWRRKALAGDPAAVRALAQMALGPLFAFCLYRVGRDRHLCEEVVQETLIRALHDLSGYDPARSGGDVFPWLSGLARNEIRRVLTGDRGRNRAESLDAMWERVDAELLGIYARLGSEPLAEEVLLRDETRQVVNATMSQLPPQYRAALEAKYVQGKSVRDIAAACGATEKAIESKLARAREAFRDTFLALARSLPVAATPASPGP
jgi:RNA polymerase sigma-70 factor (ECF subfamily)